MRCSSSAAPDRRCRGRWAVLATLLCLVFAGCRGDVAVTVEARGDGTGEITVRVGLDADAARRLADDRPLQVDDLRRAGWTVAGPEPVDGGGVVLQLSHEFGSPEEFGALAGQLSGDDGPFTGLRLDRERSLTETRLELTGTVDRRGGAAAFGDAALTGLLGGHPFGVDAAEAERLLGIDLDDAVAVSLTARLPGDVDAPGATPGDGHVTWAPRPGEVLLLRATATTRNTASLLWLAAAGVSATAAVAAALRQRSVRRRR